MNTSKTYWPPKSFLLPIIAAALCCLYQSGFYSAVVWRRLNQGEKRLSIYRITWSAGWCLRLGENSLSWPRIINYWTLRISRDLMFLRRYSMWLGWFACLLSLYLPKKEELIHHVLGRGIQQQKPKAEQLPQQWRWRLKDTQTVWWPFFDVTVCCRK